MHFLLLSLLSSFFMHLHRLPWFVEAARWGMHDLAVALCKETPLALFRSNAGGLYILEVLLSTPPIAMLQMQLGPPDNTQCLE